MFEKQPTGKVKHPKFNMAQVWIFVAGAKGTDRECFIPLGTNGYRNKNESTQGSFITTRFYSRLSGDL